MHAEEAYYQLVATMLKDGGIDWSPVSTVGMGEEGTNGWSVCHLSEEKEKLRQLDAQLNDKCSSMESEVEEFSCKITTKADQIGGMNRSAGRLLKQHDIEREMLEREYDGERDGGGHWETRKPTEFELKEEQRALLKTERFHANMVSVKTAQMAFQLAAMGIYYTKLEGTAIMEGPPTSSPCDEANAFLIKLKYDTWASCTKSFLVTKMPYNEYKRVDGEFWVDGEYAVCRMLGEVNGRTNFAPPSNLSWGEDGTLCFLSTGQ